MDYQDIEIAEFVGIDIEKEDRSVGIFGNVFILLFKDMEGKQWQLSLDDDEFQKLYDSVKNEGSIQGLDFCQEEEG